MFRATPLLLHRRGVRPLLGASLFGSFLGRAEESPALAQPETRFAPPPANIQTQAQEAKRRRFKLYRQVSMGSILGLTAGLVLSKFSHVLAFGAGIIITLVQVAATYGIHIIPYNWLGRTMRHKLRTGIDENPGFKISFALAMSLTAFIRDY